MKRKRLIHIETLQVIPYDFHILYTNKEYVEAILSFVKIHKNGKTEFLDKSKTCIMSISFEPDRNDPFRRDYLFYTNDGKTLLKRFETYCGYDRGPKFDRVVESIYENLK